LHLKALCGIVARENLFVTLDYGVKVCVEVIMSYLYPILLVIFMIVAIFLVVFILVQQGKGAGMGASFGAGASGTLFGSVGSGNFLTKSTWFLTFLFFGISVALGVMNSHKVDNNVNDFTNIEATETVKEVDNLPVADKKEEVKEEVNQDTAAPVQQEQVEATSSEAEQIVEEVKAEEVQAEEVKTTTEEAKVEETKAEEAK
jgi:preprotein translocase subunit SecG